MILKTVDNENFCLMLKLDIDYQLKRIDILVILDNIVNNRRQMKTFHGDEFEKALAQFDIWHDFIF